MKLKFFWRGLHCMEASLMTKILFAQHDMSTWMAIKLTKLTRLICTWWPSWSWALTFASSAIWASGSIGKACSSSDSSSSKLLCPIVSSKAAGDSSRMFGVDSALFCRSNVVKSSGTGRSDSTHHKMISTPQSVVRHVACFHHKVV